jgi:hypothetical protein
MTGSVSAGLILSQAIYWTEVVEEKQPDRGGWFYKKQAEWTDETCLSRWEQESARKQLRQWSFWQERRGGQPAKLWFRVDLTKLAAAISEYAEKQHSSLRKRPTLECGESPDPIAEEPQTISEITAETTSENLGGFVSRPPFSELWHSIGLIPQSLPGPFRKLCEDLFATRVSQTLSELMGACLDACDVMGWPKPAAFAKAKARIVEQEKEQPSRLPELEALPWAKK